MDKLHEIQILVAIDSPKNQAWISVPWNKTMYNGVFVNGYNWNSSYYGCVAFEINVPNKTIQVYDPWWNIVYGGSTQTEKMYYIYYR